MQTLRFGRFELQPDERRLLADGRAVALAGRAIDVLRALIERRERVVSKNELLDVVWPHLIVEENNLQVHISALRKVLGAESIATIPGRGYRFAAALESDAAAGNAGGELGAAPRQAPTNLPERLPELYGREDDLKALDELIQSHPLVSVVGAGGIGKTRLAQAAASALRGRFANGVWMVELASLTGASLVVPTVARALQVELPGREPPLDELVNALKTQTLLLVLDNCEHLLDEVSAFASRVGREAPGVRLVTTSQELLKASNERVWRLAPLAVPEKRQADDAGRFGAVRLFVERVRSLDAKFELNAGNVDAIVDICGQLDGIALAIELAAARVPMLGIAGLRERLGERLRLLSGGARASLRRHQTLRAALDWSHHLLSPAEQKVFRRLSVFVGGFTIESAERVAADETIDSWAVLDHLGALIDKSLVAAEGAQRPRYRLLETARAYAIEQLEAAGETESIRRRHAKATQVLLEQAVKRRDSELLAREMDNVRAAYAWAVGSTGDALTAVALATGSAVVLAVEGFVVEALQRLLQVQPSIDETTPPALAAQYWQWLGRLGIDGRLPVSHCIEALRRAEAMFRQQGNLRHLHACLRMQAEAMLDNAQLADAQRALDQAEAMEDAGWPAADRMRRLRVQGLLFDRMGKFAESLQTAERAYRMAEVDAIERYVLILLSDMAWVELKAGHAEEAAARFRSLAEKARLRPSGGLTRSYALAGLTAALMTQERVEEACGVAAQAVPLLQRSGLLLAHSDAFAWLMASRGHPGDAARLIGAADEFHRRSESTRNDTESRIRDHVLELVRGHCPADEVVRRMAEGARLGEQELDRLLRSLHAPLRPGSQ